MITLTTNLGDIVIELDEAKAPKTCDNFKAYVRDGHYDGTVFHRVIDGFMIQGGGFNEHLIQKMTREPIENEAKNGLSNLAGTIAMARTMQPHSATAQFYINVSDNRFSTIRARTAGATACSAASWKEWTWSTGSARSRPAPSRATRTCRPSR